MSSSYELNKQEGLPNPAYSGPYPPNPPGYPPNPPDYPPNPPGYSAYPPGFSAYPPGYPLNPSGPSVFTPSQVPTYSNIQPSHYGGQPQPGVIVTTQAMVMTLPQPAYKDYMTWSILNLIFCNLILGIVAVVFSSKTRDAVRNGHSSSAASHSHTALGLNIAALVLGIIVHVCWISWLIYWSVIYGHYINSYYNYYNDGYNG